MSKIGYRLDQALDEAGSWGKKPTFTQRIKAFKYFFIDLYYDYPHHYTYLIKTYYLNFKFFLPHIINMRNWDSSYQINLFCDSLEYLAEGLKNGHCLHSKTQYRRCLFAAKQLRKAYADKSYNDKSYVALSKANPIRWVQLKNGNSQIVHDYKKTEEHYTKMFKIIKKRTSATEEKAKTEAWAYINKHIESWWD